jgi:hypothetical protein
LKRLKNIWSIRKKIMLWHNYWYNWYSCKRTCMSELKKHFKKKLQMIYEINNILFILFAYFFSLILFDPKCLRNLIQPLFPCWYRGIFRFHNMSICLRSMEIIISEMSNLMSIKCK